jgi:hypothetical protein
VYADANAVVRRADTAATADARTAPPEVIGLAPAARAPADATLAARRHATSRLIAERRLGRRMTLERLAEELGLGDHDRAVLQETLGWPGERIRLRRLDDAQTRALAQLIRTLA